jgi:hypothetical protein
MMTTFRHRCVQDLAWVIRSPPLISGHIAQTDWWGAGHFTQEYQACLADLVKLDLDPGALEKALSNVKSYRLGHYFEALVAFWLGISPHYRLLARQIPLRNGTKTLGEIDFIIQDRKTGQIIHLEVAVKFYLGHGDLHNMTNWHGPGLKDRLDIKFEHLCRHQTQISRKHPELVPYPVDTYACLLKGRLFYPPNQPAGTLFTAPAHPSGSWCHTPPEISEQNSQLIHLTKKNWLAPIEDAGHHPAGLPPLPPAKPECFAHCYHGREQRRLFILPANFWLSAQTPAPAAEQAQQ